MVKAFWFVWIQVVRNLSEVYHVPKLKYIPELRFDKEPVLLPVGCLSHKDLQSVNKYWFGVSALSGIQGNILTTRMSTFHTQLWEITAIFDITSTRVLNLVTQISSIRKIRMSMQAHDINFKATKLSRMFVNKTFFVYAQSVFDFFQVN